MSEVIMSSKGQIVLPRNIREALRLSEGDRLSVTLENDHITIRPIQPFPPHDWRRWRGRLAGSNALREHIAILGTPYSILDSMGRDRLFPSMAGIPFYFSSLHHGTIRGNRPQQTFSRMGSAVHTSI